MASKLKFRKGETTHVVKTKKGGAKIFADETCKTELCFGADQKSKRVPTGPRVSITEAVEKGTTVVQVMVDGFADKFCFMRTGHLKKGSKEAEPEPEPESVPVVTVVTAPTKADPHIEDAARQQQTMLDELLPAGKVPAEVTFWLTLKSTASTKGLKPEAEAVNAWLIKGLKSAHLDKRLKKEVRELLSTERYACNLLFLGQFNYLKAEMTTHMTELGEQLAQIYNKDNLGGQFSDEELDQYWHQNPEFENKDVTQALMIPGLRDEKNRWFNYDTPETMDEEVALHVLMMVTIAVNPGYQERVKKTAAPYVKGIANGFQQAPPKSFSRCHNKSHSPTDYRFNAKPRSVYNIDVARNLVSANDPAKVKALLKSLSDEFGGYAKKKNLFAHSAEDRESRYHLLSIMVTVCHDAGMTFGEMAINKDVAEKWKNYTENGAGGEPQERWLRLTARAKEFLMSAHLKDEPVRLLCETQILLMDYVHVRHKMHEPYRVGRAASPAAIYNDFARSAGKHTFQDDGSTLINACNRGQVNVVKKFIDDGKYTVDHENATNGCTGLYMAAVNNHVDVIQTLIDYRCNVDAYRDTGASCVYIAAERGHADAVKLLIRAKADVNKKRTDGWSPLHNAGRRGYHDVTKILIDAGADVNTSTATSTPLTEAVKAKQAQNEAMLRQAGAKEIGEM